MGKAALLIVAVTLVSITALHMDRNNISSEIEAETTVYREKVLAREIAKSAFNVHMARVQADFEQARPRRTGVSFKNGRYDVSSTGSSGQPVTLSVTGHFGRASYEIEGTLKRSSKPILPGWDVQAPIGRVRAQENYLITGLDTPPGGAPGSGPAAATHGIIASTSASADALTAALSADQVTGMDGDGDIISDTPTRRVAQVIEKIHALPDAILLDARSTTESEAVYGSPTEPAVVITSGDLTLRGSAGGYGVLYVRGSLTMEGGAFWQGLVVAEPDYGALTMGGDAAIHGALMLGSSVCAVPFVVDGVKVRPQEAFRLSVDVLGAAITYGGTYDIPVTVQINAGSSNIEPWGSYTNATSGNVNRAGSFSYKHGNALPAGTEITISAKSWIRSGGNWVTYLTQNSRTTGANLRVLRDGDSVPAVSGFMGQASALDFVKGYLGADGLVHLEKSQAIYLFELGSNNPSSAAFDLQDLVMLVTTTPTARPNDCVDGRTIVDVNLEDNARIAASSRVIERLYSLLPTLRPTVSKVALSGVRESTLRATE